MNTNPFDGQYSTGFDVRTGAATIVRPADTTAYAAKDTIADSTSAPTVATFRLNKLANRSGYIVKVRMMTNASGFTARLRLHFYNQPPTIPNDNAPFALLWADRASRIGYVDLPAATTEGTGSDSAMAMNDTCRLSFATALDVATNTYQTSLWVVVETLDAFTPASGQQFYIVVQADAN